MEVDDYAENIHLIFEVDTPTYNTLIWGWYYLDFFWFVLTSQMDLGTEVEQLLTTLRLQICNKMEVA